MLLIIVFFNHFILFLEHGLIIFEIICVCVNKMILQLVELAFLFCNKLTYFNFLWVYTFCSSCLFNFIILSLISIYAYLFSLSIWSTQLKAIIICVIELYSKCSLFIGFLNFSLNKYISFRTVFCWSLLTFSFSYERFLISYNLGLKELLIVTNALLLSSSFDWILSLLL